MTILISVQTASCLFNSGKAFIGAAELCKIRALEKLHQKFKFGFCVGSWRFFRRHDVQHHFTVRMLCRAFDAAPVAELQFNENFVHDGAMVPNGHKHSIP